MEKKVDDFLQQHRELLHKFRQCMNKRRDAESKASSWKQRKLKEADQRLRNATDEVERVRREVTNDLAKARNALKKAKGESSKVGNIGPNTFDQSENTNINYPASDETITKLANKLTNKSSTAVRYASEVREAVKHLQNWESAKWENNRLNTSLFLLLIACCGLALFIIGIAQQSAGLIVLGLLPPPLLLACADAVWNLGQKNPGNGFSTGYLWLYLVAPIAPLVALVWIFASYPASLTAIDKRYRPRASRAAVTANIYDIIPHLMQVISEAKLYHDIILKQTQQDIEQIRQEHENSVQQIETGYKQMASETLSNYEKSWQQIQKQSTVLHQTLGLIGAPWDDSLWDSWPQTTEEAVSHYVRIGRLVDQDKRNRLVIPALVPVIGKGNIIIKCSGAAKDEAVQIVQNLMLRMLVTVPPGKLRFTLIDPVGLGQSMAAFMSLDDYDEALVGGKIWTEPQHIEEQLARLTEHMEFVIQKFLRDKYPTIEDYNTEAGEVAEPYRGLVIVDFPVNFTESAARRLVSIALNGPRCGVYTIATVDAEQQLPYGFRETEVNQEPRKRRSFSPNRRKMYPAICADCGIECEVPFRPRKDQPVYCSVCYAKMKEEENNYDDDEYEDED